jgi:hypothetical protein
MQAPKRQVKCGVDDCRYNRQHLCTAENLVINPMGDNPVNSSSGRSATRSSPFGHIAAKNGPQQNSLKKQSEVTAKQTFRLCFAAHCAARAAGWLAGRGKKHSENKYGNKGGDE